MNYTLLIDDQRCLNADVIVRTDEAALALLKLDIWHTVLFDNDLGCVLEGYQIMRKMFEIGIFPQVIGLVTSNPIAKKEMTMILTHDYGYTKKGDFFVRKK